MCWKWIEGSRGNEHRERGRKGGSKRHMRKVLRISQCLHLGALVPINVVKSQQQELYSCFSRPRSTAIRESWRWRRIVHLEAAYSVVCTNVNCASLKVGSRNCLRAFRIEMLQVAYSYAIRHVREISDIFVCMYCIYICYVLAHV